MAVVMALGLAAVTISMRILDSSSSSDSQKAQKEPKEDHHESRIKESTPIVGLTCLVENGGKDETERSNGENPICSAYEGETRLSSLRDIHHTQFNHVPTLYSEECVPRT